MKILVLSFKFHWSLFSWVYNWQHVSIGADNGLAPNWQQIITWTNDDPVYGSYMASWGNNELKDELELQTSDVQVTDL